jgi:hypothetical protein
MGRPRKQGNKDLPEGLHPPSSRGKAWRMEHPVTGLLKRLKGVTTKVEAIEVYWIIKDRYKPKVEAVAAEFTGGELVSDIAEKYRTEQLPTAMSKTGKKSLDGNTRRTYDNYLENIRDAVEFKVPVSTFADIDEGPRIIRAYLSKWLTKPKTYNYRLSCLSRLFEHCIDLGKLVRNPCDPIGHRRAPDRDVYMTDEHFISITTKLEEKYHEVYARACDWLYLMSGRPTNMLDVKESQIQEKEIHYLATKNTQPVIMERDPELDELIDWFRQYKREQKIVSPFLIVHPTDAHRKLACKHITTYRLYRCFKRAMKESDLAAEMPNYTLRDIRPKALTQEAEIEGESTNKGAHKTKSMRDKYVRKAVPMRVKNKLKRLKAG